VTPERLAGQAGGYGTETATITEGELLSRVAARRAQFTARQVARLREDGVLQIAGMEHRGTFGAGRFALYDQSASELIIEVVRLRSAGVRSNDDLVVCLVLAGHDVPPARLLRAMRAGARPLLRLVQAVGSAGRLGFADRFASALERSSAKRRALGIADPPSRIDEVARDIADDIVDVATVGAVTPTSRIPGILRHLAQITESDEEIVRSLGVVDLIDEFLAAAARMRAGLAALGNATPADATRAVIVLKDIVALRDVLVREGAAGDAVADLFGRGLSIVPSSGAFGLFIGFVVSRMIVELASEQRISAHLV
jgi:hypothetical protein